MEKCTPTGHKCSFTTWLSSWQCNYSKKRQLSYGQASFAKTTDTPMSGSAVKSHDWPNMGKVLSEKTDNFVPLVAPGLCVNSASSSSSTAPPQESLGSELQQAPPQIQYQSEVTNKPQGDLGRNLWEVTRRTRIIRWQIRQSGWRISQII